MTKKQWQDSVTVVNQDDQVLDFMDKYKAHQKPPVLHRAISVWIKDENNNILLQQRSEKKIVGAGQWGNAVCGHVRKGETTQNCVYRRLYQELGLGNKNEWDRRVDKLDKNFQEEKINKYKNEINWQVRFLYKFTYQVECNQKYAEYEVDHVFVGQINRDKFESLNLNPSEVSSVDWVDKEELFTQKNHPLTPWTKIMLEHKELSNFLS